MNPSGRSRLPQLDGSTRSRLARPRTTAYSSRAPPSSFASTPLRTNILEETDDGVSFGPAFTFPSSPPRPLAPTGSIPAPLSPRSALIAEQLAGIDPRASIRSSAVGYDIPRERRTKINPSFEPTPQEVLEMLEEASEEALLPPCAPVVQNQAYGDSGRMPAPVKLEIPASDRRMPKVIPSFDISPELSLGVIEEEYVPEETPPCTIKRREPASSVPAPLAFEIAIDDHRKPKVIPTYERTPEDMLPPLELPQAPKKRQTRGPKASSGGVMWELPATEEASRPRVRHSWESDEEGLQIEGLEPETLPSLAKRPSVGQIRDTSRRQPQRAETQRTQSQRAQARIPSRAQQQRASAAPDIARRRLSFAGNKPPPPVQRETAPRTSTATKKRLPATKPKPKEPVPQVCRRVMQTSYVTPPQQYGGSPVEIHEEILDVRAKTTDQAKLAMLALQRQREFAEQQEARRLRAAPVAALPTVITNRPVAIAAPPRPVLDKANVSKAEQEMMDMARRRRLTESTAAGTSRGKPRERASTSARGTTRPSAPAAASKKQKDSTLDQEMMLAARQRYFDKMK